jgi:hypothetical protein
MRFHLTLNSRNSKTGNMPVATSSKDTCPVHCPLRERVCYARYGKLGFWWQAISRELHGSDLRTFIGKVSKIPEGALWRYGQAGDLPGDGRKIDARDLRSIVNAQSGRRGFCYTHYLARPRGWTWSRWMATKTFRHNLDAIRNANERGFTINISADTFPDADRLVRLNAAPVVVLVTPENEGRTGTALGRRIRPCAHYEVGLQCVDCGLCARADRLFIIGLPVHGSGRGHVPTMRSSRIA